MKNVLLGVQARSNSTRFHRKIYQKIGDKTVLQMCYEACVAANVYPKILNVTTYVLGVKSDTELMEYLSASAMRYLCIECDENDVMERYMQAASQLEADFIVRITSDCPLLPTALIERCIEGLLSDDYCSNTVTRSYPDGFDVQGCSRKALEWFNTCGSREHPFKEFDRNEKVREAFEKEGFTWREILNRDNVIFDKRSVDTEQDLERVRRIAQKTA